MPLEAKFVTERIKIFFHLNLGIYKMLINSSLQMHDDAAPRLIRSYFFMFRSLARQEQ